MRLARAAFVSRIFTVRGTPTEGRTKTGDIDNISEGRFGGLLVLSVWRHPFERNSSGSLAILAAIRRA